MKISVVIPALDEEREIGGAVESAWRTASEDAAPEVSGEPGEAGGAGGGGEAGKASHTDEARRAGKAARAGAAGAASPSAGVEVLVVDGGSSDATVEQARRAGAVVHSGPAGRARQLEAGFRASTGDAVLFLHADTRLPPGWDAAVRRALADPAVAGGAFRFAFDRRGVGAARRAALALVEAGARLRVALFALPYGDQALFVRRSLLDAIGGVPSSPIMEDLDLVRQIKARGRLARLPLAAPTSPRRHLARGIFRTACRHLAAAAAWRLGLDRERVAAWVRR